MTVARYDAKYFTALAPEPGDIIHNFYDGYRVRPYWTQDQGRWTFLCAYPVLILAVEERSERVDRSLLVYVQGPDYVGRAYVQKYKEIMGTGSRASCVWVRE